MSEDVSLEEFKSEVEDSGGFESVKFSPHMRFRAGQRRLNWDNLKDKLRSGDIEDIEINHNPNESIPYEEAYVIFLSLDEQNLIVPFYILEDSSMKAVTVMRE
jgi:hypothetical protein